MKNKKKWFRFLTAFLVTILLTGTISTGALSASAATVNTQILDEDVEALAKALELIFESGQITEGNEILGYNKKMFEKELQGNENFQEVINQLEEEGLFAEITEPTMSTRAVACDWHGMKKKPAYVKAQNTCITNELKANYGPVTVVSTIANLVADKQFTLAAKKIIALGIRSNVAGIIVTLGYIMLKCNKEMEKKYPGKTNCY